MLKVHFVFLIVCIISSVVVSGRTVRKNGDEDDDNTRFSDYANIEDDTDQREKDKKAEEKAMRFGQQVAQEAMRIAANAQAQQEPMGQKASQEAMQRLADKAEAFAQQADAVLAGKVAIVEEIMQEIAEASDVVTEETSSLSRLKDVLQDSRQMSRASRREVKILCRSMAYTRSILASLEATQRMLMDHIEKTKQVIDAAKEKVGELRQVLNRAKADLGKAKVSVQEENEKKAMTHKPDPDGDDAQYPDDVGGASCPAEDKLKGSSGNSAAKLFKESGSAGGNDLSPKAGSASGKISSSNANDGFGSASEKSISKTREADGGPSGSRGFDEIF